MQKSIALALLFGSASAAPGPEPASVGSTLLFTSDKTEISTATGEDQFPIKYAAVTSGASNKKTGLYGCIRNANVPMATQAMAYNSSNKEIEVVDTQKDSNAIRSFYQTTEAMQGDIAQITVGAAATLNWDGYTYPGDQADHDLVVAITGNFFECCALGVTGADAASIRTCPTQFSITVNTDNDGMDAAVDAGALQQTSRLNFYNNQVAGPFTIGQPAISYNEDFILGAMGQLSDETDAADNWCSKFFKTAVTDTATYSAKEGFNSKTKCSWQVSAEAESAPSFALASTTSNTQNLIQWIEWSSDSNGVAGMTAGSILAAAQESAQLASNFGIGNYVADDGAFFNPFSKNLADLDQSMLYKNILADGQSVWDGSLAGFVKYTYNQNIAGSPGKAEFWQNSADNLDYQLDSQNVFTADMGIFTTVLDYAKPAYAAYDSALTTFNTDAAAYNDAVAAYNTALTDTPKELPVVMERPCPPTKPAAITGFEIVMDDTVDMSTAIETKTTGIAEYVQQNGDTTKINDAKRFGYVMSADVYEEDEAFVSATAHAGHVFGRLGQGKMNMPGTVSPWKWFTQPTSIQHLMVSIFPEDGTAYNGVGVGALLADESIDIEISSAALSITDGFELPSASATAALALTDKDAAQALVFSAVALAAAVASLY